MRCADDDYHHPLQVVGVDGSLGVDGKRLEHDEDQQ